MNKLKHSKSMKKLLIILTLCFSSQFVNAQDDGEERVKNFHFGLKVNPNLSYIKPHLDNKTIKSDGTSLRFGYGLITDFRLNKVISFSSGVEVFGSGGRIDFAPSDSAFYMFVPEGESKETKFYATARNMALTFVDVPITFKMKTPEIGSMKYFGVFGTNLGIRAKARATDVGTYIGKSGPVYNFESKNINIADQVSPIRMSLNVGLGAEYNLIGSTSLVVSLNYLQGYTSTLKKKQTEVTSLKKPLDLKSFNNAFALTVGVIF